MAVPRVVRVRVRVRVRVVMYIRVHLGWYVECLNKVANVNMVTRVSIYMHSQSRPKTNCLLRQRILQEVSFDRVHHRELNDSK